MNTRAILTPFICVVVFASMIPSVAVRADSCITPLASTLGQHFSVLERQFQLPAGILANVAQVESGGNPNANAPSSSALGMFQWLTKSWYAATRAACGAALQGSLRTNPFVSARITAFSLAGIKSRIGGLISQAKVDMKVGIYMGHFLGEGGARQFFQAYLQNPAASASSVFPKAAAANPGVFRGRSLAQVLNFFAAKMKATGVPNINATDSFNPYSIGSNSFPTDPRNSFMPASFVPPSSDSERDYQTDYASYAAPPAAQPAYQKPNSYPGLSQPINELLEEDPLTTEDIIRNVEAPNTPVRPITISNEKDIPHKSDTKTPAVPASTNTPLSLLELLARSNEKPLEKDALPIPPKATKEVQQGAPSTLKPYILKDENVELPEDNFQKTPSTFPSVHNGVVAPTASPTLLSALLVQIGTLLERLTIVINPGR